MTYGSPEIPRPRKGSALLTRLNTTIYFESTIEERLFRVMDMDLRITSVTRASTIKSLSQMGPFMNTRLM